MITGFFIAAILGGLALPELARLSEDDDEEATAEDGSDPADGRNGDMLAKASIEEVGEGQDLLPEPGDAAADMEDEDRLVEFDPGTHEVLDFDPEDDALDFRVPENSTGYLSHPGDDEADPPVPPSLTFEIPDGAVEVRFPGLSEVPTDAITIREGAGPAIPLSQMLLDDVDGLMPASGDMPALPRGSHSGASQDESETVSTVASDAPEMSPAPREGAPSQEEHSRGHEDDDGEVSVRTAAEPKIMAPRLVDETTHDQGDPPALIRFFAKGFDLLQIHTDLEGEVTIRASDDGSDGQIWIGGTQVANVANAPDLGLNDLEVVRTHHAFGTVQSLR